jgi:predicted metal-binding protein
MFMSDWLKSYPSPWNGHLLLACKKCQKKITPHKEHKGLSKLKKAIKTSDKQRSSGGIHVLNVPCMKICPKRGVAVYDPHRSKGQLYILRRDEDVDGLIEAVNQR